MLNGSDSPSDRPLKVTPQAAANYIADMLDGMSEVARHCELSALARLLDVALVEARMIEKSIGATLVSMQTPDSGGRLH
ncbi:MAG: hypothetical protein WDM89_22175 [Rhizomicrobium sp.]